MIKAILLWFLFIPIPIINGLLREKWYRGKLSEIKVNIIGFIVLSSIFVLYVYLFLSQEILKYSFLDLLQFGVLWLSLTLIFEFSLGFSSGKSLRDILKDYNIFQGKTWPFILLVIFLSPFIVYYLVK